ncbi:MAG: FeoA family protein [Helicobacteraceae bacterium]
MSLSDLEVGKTGKILSIETLGAIAQKLIDMGFVIGEKVKVVRNAPLKDPIEVQISSYLISIRREEASFIMLEEIGL